MYLARFSYELLPRDRQQAIALIRREVVAAQANGLAARLLVPLTRGQGQTPALQFEVELTSLDQLEQLRHHSLGTPEETANWMHAFSEILTSPPAVEILRVDEPG